MGQTNDIVADAPSIAGLAKQFATFKTDIDTATAKLADVKIVAGDFVDAHDLETTVQERTEQLKKTFEAIAKALDIISTKLTAIANKYTKTEEQNGLTADAVQDIVDGVDTALPVLG